MVMARDVLRCIAALTGSEGHSDAAWVQHGSSRSTPETPSARLRCSKLTPEENPPHGAVLLSTGQLLAWAAALAFFGVFIAVPLRTQTILRRVPSAVPLTQGRKADPMLWVPCACPSASGGWSQSTSGLGHTETSKSPAVLRVRISVSRSLVGLKLYHSYSYQMCDHRNNGTYDFSRIRKQICSTLQITDTSKIVVMTTTMKQGAIMTLGEP